MKLGKSFFLSFCLVPVLAACSTNPATGRQQFAGLMPAGQEAQIGASEHQKIEAQFGFYQNAALQNYVNEIGRKVTADTERPDVQYKFFIIDSPIINAFALPGGYIYVSRGLLALADNEAELAAVLAHEAGHITARHSAERYSQGVLTTLGVGILSAAVDNSGVSQALGVGSDLYLSSYSRGQESEADSLGLRYMSRGGYDALAMPEFLSSMQKQTALDARVNGQGSGEEFSYFATHPATADRVEKTRVEAGSYAKGGRVEDNRYLRMINGLTYGDSEKQGFARGRDFFHPQMGFTFRVPEGFRILNQTEQVAALSESGALILFDVVPSPKGLSPAQYISGTWMKSDKGIVPEKISVNGMEAASAAFPGNVNGRPMVIRLVAVNWKGGIARFQFAIPRDASPALVEDFKHTTYSFRPLNENERASLKPAHIRIVTAAPSDTISSLLRLQPFTAHSEDLFRVLNNLKPGEGVMPGKKYKIVVE